MTSEDLNMMIDALARSVKKAGHGGTSWRAIWSQIREVGAGFKGIRYPTTNDREMAWARFQGLVESVKSAQNLKQSADKRQSENHANEIRKLGECARPTSGLISSLSDAGGAVLDSLLPSHGDEDRRLFELKRYSSRLKEAWALLSNCKDEMLATDKKEVFDFLRGVQEDLNTAWEAWRKAKGLQDIERRGRLDVRKAKRRENLEANRQRLKKQLDALARSEAHLNELEEKRNSASNGNYQERVNGWIEEEEARIEDIKESIRRIELWIEQDEDDLNR
jgi:hypothetical protein